MSEELERRPRGVRPIASALALLLSGCGPPDGGFEPTPPDQRSSPYAEDGARCQDRYARGELMEREDAADPAALRCLLSIRDLEPDAFNLRYRLYRIEGVEPEGLDALVRSRTRRELAADLANLHGRYPELAPADFHPMSGCRMYDSVARELLQRTPAPQDGFECSRWGY
ncbi:MAG: hypothetical protein RKE49_01370 [Oceanicaulis sp.]